ncbi:unnamed protein product [Bursaphelenchus okinawaensis]|uniref:Major facilitator superfamily (MFS) profile domain-containing protein n=1 Tax=Bursaphelenchus okinawaensis TaxID=465554 RepID=A0A811LJ91_9BILA|nr:unnamed protein product [Bursaphelenchus okinawaensis]CAG9127156.1 unnamed protein product [Bursaphelenchus okinawaensis]
MPKVVDNTKHTVEKVKVNNKSRKAIIGIIYIAMLIDYLLTTCVVPIVPDFLIKLWTADGTLHLKSNGTVDYSEISIPVGLLFGSKSVVQIIFNFIAGPLTNHIGYSVVMFSGFALIAASTITFMLSKAYWMLFVARSVQGIGSALTVTAGLGLAAKMYTEESERGRAIGAVLGGLALGGVIGPSYGGILYEYGGIMLPLGILAVLAMIDGLLQAIVLRPKLEKEEVKGTKIGTLMTDPYILITSGAIFISNLGISVLQPTLPLWMIRQWNSSSAQQGMIFFPCTFGYLINSQIFGSLAHKFGRWRSSIAGLGLIAAAGTIIPFCPNIYFLIVPVAITGLGIGIVDSTMFPMLGTIVDKRHSQAYGSVFGIGDSAVCLAFAVGPFLAGPLVRIIGFKYTIWCMAASNLLYAPILFLLQKIETTKKEEVVERQTTFTIDNKRFSEIGNPSNQSLNSLSFN